MWVIKNKMENENKQPEIILTPLEKTAIYTETREKYRTLMEVLECGDSKWDGGELPTKMNSSLMVSYEKLCIDRINNFTYAKKDYFREKGYEIISTEEFYEKQKITPEQIDTVKRYFESKQ